LLVRQIEFDLPAIIDDRKILVKLGLHKDGLVGLMHQGAESIQELQELSTDVNFELLIILL
jgi:hypothetical protein